ncbi:PD-(D/E)XK nuclease family protein [Sulfurimonas sp. NW15]|uniref:PDDEXK-like family protein n=1 Tax=Sulfurimonas sp. NW15 TaxID=2922729 RepID=UPI003DAA0CDF
MLGDEYQTFFKKINDFLLDTEHKKLRGINDYNMLSIVRNKHEEVGLHSQLIFSLLNPQEKHNQNDLFLNIFIKEVLKIKDFGDIISIKREDLTYNNRRIDFTIESSNYYIGIEMKTNHYTEDQPSQISHYEEELLRRNNKDTSKQVKIYYLTLNGKNASKKSSNGSEYTKISFQDEMLVWINKCMHEVSNITNLSILLSQYKDIIEQITNQYESKLMTLREYLKKDGDENTFEILEILTKDFWMQKKRIKEDFFKNILTEKLIELFTNDSDLKKESWIIQVVGNLNNSYDGRLEIFKNDWKIKFVARFEKKNMNSFYWAFLKDDNNINLEDIRNIFPKLKNIKPKTSTSLQWDYFRDNRNNTIYKNLDNYLVELDLKPDRVANHIFITFKKIKTNFEEVYEASFDNINLKAEEILKVKNSK